MKHPKAECEELVDVVLPFAEQMLLEHGEFHPFGAAMKIDGEVVSVSALDGRDFPPAVDMIQLLKDSYIKAARDGAYKATALAYDVRVTLSTTQEKTDAVAVSLNHEDGYSVVALFPYKIENGSVIFGDALAQAGEGDIFPRRLLS